MRVKSILTDTDTYTRVGSNFPAGKFGESEIQWKSVVCPKQSPHKRLFVEVVPVHGENHQNFPRNCSDRKSPSQVKIKELTNKISTESKVPKVVTSAMVLSDLKEGNTNIWLRESLLRGKLWALFWICVFTSMV